MNLCQRLRSTNDASGNPRRLWLVYSTPAGPNLVYCTVDHVIDEKHSGMPVDLFQMLQLPSIEVSPEEYRAWSSWAKTHERYETQS